MTASELATRVPDSREIKPGKWAAPCPIHGGQSGRSFAFEDSEDGSRILALCRAGCRTEDVLMAIGLRMSDLRQGQEHRQDPKVQRQARANRGLAWRQRQLTIVCNLLRFLDDLVDEATQLLGAYGKTHTGTREQRGAAWDTLAFCYHQITELEFDHERLNSKDSAKHLEFWRQFQGVADAAS